MKSMVEASEELAEAANVFWAELMRTPPFSWLRSAIDRALDWMVLWWR